jgi:hypothetical protein
MNQIQHMRLLLDANNERRYNNRQWLRTYIKLEQ